jgi:hypothetical protein
MGERAPWAEATDIEEPKNLPTILLEVNIRMAKEIRRKPAPEPPKWFWWANDACRGCNRKRHGCRGCKRLKEMRAEERERRECKEKSRLHSEAFQEET